LYIRPVYDLHMWAWTMGWLSVIMETLFANAGVKHRGRLDSISSSGEYLIDFHSL